MPNKSQDRYMVVPNGAVMTSGFSAELANGQIGLFNTGKVGKKGATAVANTTGANKGFDKFEFRLGVANVESRTLSNKASKTIPFTLNDVSKAWVGRPHITEQKFDEWYIGFNGTDNSKSLKFFPGDTFEFDLELWGKPLGVLALNDTKTFLVKIPMMVPENYDRCDKEDGCEEVSCVEPTLEMVQKANDYQIPTGDTLSKYFTIIPMLDTPTSHVLKNYKLFELQYCGSDKTGEQAKVQAQYPGYEVVQDEFTGKFQILVPETPVQEGEGNEFVPPANYVTSLPALIPGCEGCPSGYSTIDGGYVYIVQIEDDGVDMTAVPGEEQTTTNAFDGLTGYVADSAEKLSQDFGVGYYMFLTEGVLEDSEISAFIVENPTAVFTFGGEKGDLCVNNSTVSVAWVGGPEAVSTTQDYEIILKDDCDGSRLTELQAAYPDLTITEASAGGTYTGAANCIRKYKTTVTTDIKFPEGCPNATVLEKVFTSEAPSRYDVNAFWVPVAPSENASTYCGIYIKAKPVIVNAVGECLIDELPFIASSVRIKPAGGYITNMYLNNNIVNRPFPTLQVSRAADLDNLGGDMRGFEKQGKYYFQNESYKTSVFARAALGTENQLEGLTQYNDYAFQVDRSTHTEGFGAYNTTSLVYHFFTPVGKSNDVEALFNSFAAGAGVPVESL